MNSTEWKDFKTECEKWMEANPDNPLVGNVKVMIGQGDKGPANYAGAKSAIRFMLKDDPTNPFKVVSIPEPWHGRRATYKATTFENMIQAIVKNENWQLIYVPHGKTKKAQFDTVEELRTALWGPVNKKFVALSKDNPVWTEPVIEEADEEE